MFLIAIQKVEKMNLKQSRKNLRYCMRFFLCIEYILTLILNAITFLVTMANKMTARKWTGFNSKILDDVSIKITDACESYISRTKNIKIQFLHEKVFINQHDYIYTITCRPENESITDSQIVLCHGYGAGCIFYTSFMAELAVATNRTIVAIDWLGMAGSSRPKFPQKDTQSSVDYFLDSFELWRLKKGFEKLDLFGHSLGGYLVGRYAKSKPEIINKLFLLSPAGLNDHYHVTTLEQARSSGDAASNPMLKNEFRAKIFIKVATRIWEWNLTPQSILSFFGPLSKRMTKGTIVRRFGNRQMFFYGLSDDDETKNLVVDYLHQISVAPLCAEKCLNFILGPGAFGRDPLKEYLNEMNSFPVHLFYGEMDWMDIACGEETVGKMKENGCDATFTVVPKCGHQLFIQNTVQLVNDVLNKL